MLSLLYGPTLTSMHDYRKKHSFDYTDLCCLLFNTRLGLARLISTSWFREFEMLIFQEDPLWEIMPQKRASQQRPRLKSCRFPPHLTCRYLSCSCDKACCLLLNSVSSLQNFCGSWFFPELYEDLHKALKKPKRHHMGSFFAFLRFCGELTSTNLVLYNF